MNIGRAIEKLREKKGISLRELAEKAGWSSHSGIAQIIKGKTSPRMDTIERIAKALDVPPIILILEGTTKEERKQIEKYFWK